MGSGPHWKFPLLQQPLTTTMKAVLALLLVCLVQISSAEEQENVASEGNLLLQREVREAARGKNKEGCDKKCRKALRQARKKDRKKSRQLKKKKNAKPSSQGKKGKNGGRKAGRKTVKGRPGKKKGKKGPKDTRKVSKNKTQIKESNGPRSSPTSGTGRQDTCFTDMVAKTKKFNKAQVEFRLAKRVESWGKLMKNKKKNKKTIQAGRERQ